MRYNQRNLVINDTCMERTAHRILEEIAEEKKELRVQILLTALAGLGLVLGVVGQWFAWPFEVVTAAFVLAYAAGGLPAAKEAFSSLWEGELNIDLLMVLAALAAAGVGEPRDGAILLFLFSLAGTLEHYAMGNTKRSVAALMDLRPDEATRRLPDGSTERVLVESLAVDDVVLVRPGERVPIDGLITAGAGAVDQSPITGESLPVDKVVGDKVFAGSVNQNVLLTIMVTAPASHSTLARMIELVTEAQEKKSPSERFSDWFGQRYTIAVLVGSASALGVFLFLDMPTDLAFYKAATLLVVASPCAIVISVPAAVLSALAAAARHGVLFKGGAALEDFGNATVLALDKTGTLTTGTMQVATVVPLVASRTELLAVAGSVESHSDHPLARSVVAYVQKEGVAFSDAGNAEAIPGKGVRTTLDGAVAWAGNRALAADMSVTITSEVQEQLLALEASGETPMLIGRGDSLLGIVTLADTVRESAAAAMASLRTAGVRQCVMLTGDTPTVATAVGNRLGFEAADVRGGLLPEDKVRVVTELAQGGKSLVAFVGDGVNDAAALATARVGVAMGVAGTDAALEAADVALLSDDLRKLAFSYQLSKRANRIIRQNLIFACGIMAVMVVTTVFWYLPLPLGVIGHEGGTLLVVANGLRLLLSRSS